MNASDERNLTCFKRQLEATTQMCSVMSNDSRPNCLVLDEIDGAPVVSTKYIVDIHHGPGVLKWLAMDKLNLACRQDIYFYIFIFFLMN